MSDQDLRVEMTRVKEVTPMEGMDRIELAWLFQKSPKGEPVIVSKNKFAKGELLAYIPPDHVVPDVSEFSFLERKPEAALLEGSTHVRRKNRRVKPMKLRGYISHGLTLSLDEVAEVARKTSGEKVKHVEGSQIGEALGITRYEPKQQRGQSMAGSPVAQFDFAPCGVEVPKYDLTGIRKLGDIFGWEGQPSDQELVITEKLHGTNGRYMVRAKRGLFKRLRWVLRVLTGRAQPQFEDAFYRLYVSSRGVWRDPKGGSLWAEVAEKKRLFTALKRMPGIAFYGEIIGQRAQGEQFKYGLPADVVDFRLFDGYNPDTRAWLGWDEVEDAAAKFGLRTAPVFAWGKLRFEDFEGMEEGDSLLSSNTMREGFVVRTLVASYTPRGGRAIMKWKSEKFLQKHG